MPDLKISNIPQPLIDKINSFAEQSKYHDRSEFLIAALQDYCLFHDRYFMHCLPDAIRILSEGLLKKEAKKDTDLLEYALKNINASNNLMQQLCDILSGEYELELPEIEDDL
jgi:hypothetical protein